MPLTWLGSRGGNASQFWKCSSKGACAPVARRSASPSQLSLRPLVLIPSSPPQVNAFCNTDDITWGTKNLDTKKDATEAKTLLKSGLAYSANQVRGVGQRASRCEGAPGISAQQGGVMACPLTAAHLITAHLRCRPRRASPSGRR